MVVHAKAACSDIFASFQQRVENLRFELVQSANHLYAKLMKTIERISSYLENMLFFSALIKGSKLAHSSQWALVTKQF